jgi:hypothetical protein
MAEKTNTDQTRMVVLTALTIIAVIIGIAGVVLGVVALQRDQTDSTRIVALQRKLAISAPALNKASSSLSAQESGWRGSKQRSRLMNPSCRRSRRRSLRSKAACLKSNLSSTD